MVFMEHGVDVGKKWLGHEEMLIKPGFTQKRLLHLPRAILRYLMTARTFAGHHTTKRHHRTGRSNSLCTEQYLDRLAYAKAHHPG